MALAIEEKYDQVRQFVNMGMECGYLLHDDLNDILPAEVHSLEDIGDLLSTVERYGIEAAKPGNQCRGKGIVVSIVDVLLCAVPTKREWAIFTTDLDFANYAKVLPLKIHAPRN